MEETSDRLLILGKRLLINYAHSAGMVPFYYETSLGCIQGIGRSGLFRCRLTVILWLTAGILSLLSTFQEIGNMRKVGERILLKIWRSIPMAMATFCGVHILLNGDGWIHMLNKMGTYLKKFRRELSLNRRKYYFLLGVDKLFILSKEFKDSNKGRVKTSKAGVIMLFYLGFLVMMPLSMVPISYFECNFHFLEGLFQNCQHSPDPTSFQFALESLALVLYTTGLEVVSFPFIVAVVEGNEVASTILLIIMYKEFLI